MSEVYDVLTSLILGIASAVLLTAGVTKIVNRVGFQQSLEDNPLVEAWAPFVVRVVPAVEVAFGLLLLLVRVPKVVGGAAGGLFCLFTIAAWAGGPGECGCGPFVPARRTARMAFAGTMGVSLFAISIIGIGGAWEDRFLLGASGIIATISFMALRSAREAGWMRRHGSDLPIEEPQ